MPSKTFRAPTTRAHGAWRSKSLALVPVAGVVAAALAAGGASAEPSANNRAAASAPSQITIADDNLVNTLNPMANDGYETVQLTFLWGGYLATYVQDPGPGKPELAQSLTPSDGLRTWTVKLRPGLSFSDGSSLTAKDVVASYDFWAKQPNAKTESVVGPLFIALKSVKATSGTTAVFTFSHPLSDFVKLVATPELPILPAAGLAEGKRFWNHPVSAGRYQLTKTNLVDGSYRLDANPHYYGPAPKVKNLSFISVPNAATRLADLKSGQVQYADNLPGDLLSQLTGKLRPDPAIWPAGGTWVVFNLHKTSLVSNPKIREAINLAVNRKQIVQDALGGGDGQVPLYGPDWNTAGGSPDVRPFSPNLKKARALLRGTACQSGCTLLAPYGTTGPWQIPATIEVVAQQLDKIGVNLRLEGVPGSENPFANNKWEISAIVSGDYNTSPASVATYDAAGSWLDFEGFDDSALTKLGAKFEQVPASKLPSIEPKVNKLFESYLALVPLTTLSYTAGTSEPASVMSNTAAAYLNIN